jgi:hypothetical protein
LGGTAGHSHEVIGSILIALGRGAGGLVNLVAIVGQNSGMPLPG